MTISANFPNVQPSLLLDFANAKQLPPLVTFTRATTATYYDGHTTALAEQNLALQSQAFNTTPWSAANGTVSANVTTAPDGTSTADLLYPSGAGVITSVSQGAVAVTYIPATFSVYAKANGINNIWFISGNNSSAAVWFNVSAGTVGTTVAGYTASIVSVGSGWYRCIVTGSFNALQIGISASDGSYTSSASGTNGVYLWGCQAETRSSVTAYTATTTASITNYNPVLLTAGGGQPRFQHNPITGESLGLLIEEQKTNFVSYSSQFDDSYWTKVNCSITANANIAPDGTLSADLATATSGTEEVYKNTSKAASATTYTWSVYAKNYSGVTTSFSIYLSDNSTGQATGTYDFSAVTASATNGSWTNSSATITPVGNGWFRCTLTATSPANAGLLVGITWGSGSGQAVFIWGAQLEANAYATSYIPTTTASATRAADSASMTGANFSSWFNAGEGTIIYNTSTGTYIQDARLFWQLDNNVSGYYQIFYASYSVSGNYYPPTYIPTGGTSTGPNLNAFAFDTTSVAVSTNGTAAVTGSGLTYDFSSAARFSFGQANVPVSKMAFYPKKLTNTNIQSLTA